VRSTRPTGGPACPSTKESVNFRSLSGGARAGLSVLREMVRVCAPHGRIVAINAYAPEIRRPLMHTLHLIMPLEESWHLKVGPPLQHQPQL